MGVSTKVGDHDVLESGVVLAAVGRPIVFFLDDMVLTIEIGEDSEDKSQRIIPSYKDGKNASLNIVNPSGSGMGIKYPITVGSYQSRRLYFQFWLNLQGETKVREFVFTFFLGEPADG